MATIGENRLAIYTLLFQHPLCNYIQNGKLDVLILGDDRVGVEALKAVYWCGVYPKTQLTITVATEDPSTYKTAFEDVFPGIQQLGDALYATIKCVTYAEVDAVAIENAYVITSVDFAAAHTDVVDSMKQRYGDDAVNVVSDADAEVTAELFRIAQNINFMYEETFSWVLNRQAVDKAFRLGYKEDFTKPSDSEDSVADRMKSFTQGKYDVDSSLAAAVHTAYKFAYCGGEENYAAMLKEAGDPLNLLTWWEHCRWNAYMVMRGYRYPNDTEREEMLANGKRKDDDARLHLCLCEGGKEGVDDALFSKKPKDAQCALDRFSLTFHKKLTDYVKKHDIPLSEPIKAAYPAYVDAVQKLKHEAQNALWLYEIKYRDALFDAKQRGNVAVVEDLENANRCEEMKCYKAMNEKVNFYAYDRQLLEMLPLCCSIGKETLTVVTRLDTYKAACAMTPWLLYADTVVYLSEDDGFANTDKGQALRKFFEDHGDYTTVIFSTDSPEATVRRCRENGETVVIDKTAMEDAMDFTPDPSVSVVSFDRKAGLLWHTDTVRRNVKSKELSVEDFIRLIPAKPLHPGEQPSLNNPATIQATPFIRERDINDFKEDFWESMRRAEWNTQGCQLEKFFLQNMTGRNVHICVQKFQGFDHRKYVHRFLDLLENHKVLEGPPIKIGSHTEDEALWEWDITVKEEKLDFYKWMFEKNGNLFEGITYYALLNGYPFSDVQINNNLIWSKKPQNGKRHNEIDIIATKGVRSLLVSCKSTNNLQEEYIDEIANEARCSGSIPVLAFARTWDDLEHDYKEELRKPAPLQNVASPVALRRYAAQKNVVILDAQILKSESETGKALCKILDGE